MPDGRAWNPTSLPGNPDYINPDALAEPGWELTAPSLAVSFLPKDPEQGWQILGLSSIFSTPVITADISHQSQTLPRSLKEAWGGFSAPLFKAATANQSDRRADKHICQPDLDATRFSNPIFTSGEETRHARKGLLQLQMLKESLFGGLSSS